MVMSKGLTPHLAFIFSLYLSHFEADIRGSALKGPPSPMRAAFLSLSSSDWHPD